MYPNDSNLAGIFEICDESNILFIDKKMLISVLTLWVLLPATITCIGTAGLEYNCLGNPCSNSQFKCIFWPQLFA